MCGICGIFNAERTRPVEMRDLEEMNRQIIHRGPDDGGFHVEENVGLAMRRLSIIDLSTGHQPISNETGDIWIVFNGEIYNYKQLRQDLLVRGHSLRTHSDTETIVHLYEEYGRDCVKHLRGMFAFVLWDRRKRVLFGARDRLGIKPFYYRRQNRTLLFGSEIKTILSYPGVEPRANRRTLSEFLAFGYISGEETMYEGISKLPPGHWLEADESGSVTIEQWWDLSVPVDTDSKPKQHYVKQYRQLLEECVSSHLMSDVPLGMFLSGGLDSSAVAALATKFRSEPIKTFSVGYAEEAFSELKYAREVADHIGAEHHEVIMSQQDFFDALPKLIWHEDEPLVWPSSVSLFFVAQLARKHVTVVLTGEGSDETLAGYTRYAWTVLNSRMDRLYRAVAPAMLRRLVRGAATSEALGATLRRKLEHTFLGRDGASWQSFYLDNFYSAFSAEEQEPLLSDGLRGEIASTYTSNLAFWERSSGDFLHRLLYSDIKTYLVELLMKQDQMSMAASIESRVPFLDHVLVEYTATIPEKHSIEGLAGKEILKEAVRDLLPSSIIDRKKLGFPTPWSGWLQGGRLDEIEAMLLEPRSVERGLFKPEAVKNLFAEHRARQRDNTNRVWRLLNLELWQRVCVDRDPAFDKASEGQTELAGKP